MMAGLLAYSSQATAAHLPGPGDPLKWSDDRASSIQHSTQYLVLSTQYSPLGGPMADPRVQGMRNLMPRFVAAGVDFNDARRVLDRLEQWDDWAREWSAVGAEHEA